LPAPSTAVKHCLLDLAVLDAKRPSTQKDGCIGVHVALTQIDAAHRPAPSRLRERTYWVVVGDAARARHGWMLRHDCNELSGSSSPRSDRRPSQLLRRVLRAGPRGPGR